MTASRLPPMISNSPSIPIGNGQYLQSFYEDVSGIEVLDPHKLKFTFKTRNSMKPLLTVAQSSPLPRHWWNANGRDITKTTLEPLLGSGAYRIKAVDPGRSITYERVTDYWAADLPVNRGLNNFDQIRYDYYLDDTVLFEAFMAGRIDFRQENRAQRWNGYDVPAVKDGNLIKQVCRTKRPEAPGLYLQPPPAAVSGCPGPGSDQPAVRFQIGSADASVRRVQAGEKLVPQFRIRRQRRRPRLNWRSLRSTGTSPPGGPDQSL